MLLFDVYITYTCILSFLCDGLAEIYLWWMNYWTIVYVCRLIRASTKILSHEKKISIKTPNFVFWASVLVGQSIAARHYYPGAQITYYTLNTHLFGFNLILLLAQRFFQVRRFICEYIIFFVIFPLDKVLVKWLNDFFNYFLKPKNKKKWYKFCAIYWCCNISKEKNSTRNKIKLKKNVNLDCTTTNYQ